MLNFCPKCGNKLTGDPFCGNCGADLRKYYAAEEPKASEVAQTAANNSVSIDDSLSAITDYAKQAVADKRLEEEQRRAEEARRAEEQRRAEEARRAEEQRRAEEARRAEEQRRAEEARRAEEKRRAAEAEKAQLLKRKIIELKDNFYCEENSDGTYIITGVVDEEATSMTIPDIVSEIGYSAFEDSSIDEIVIPYGVKSIGSYAFRNSQLSNIVIPSSVEYIASDAFEDCDYLSNVTIKLSSKLAQDGISGIFPSDCKIDVSIGSNVTEIGDNAFEDCILDNIDIPYGVKSIGSYAFRNAEISDIVIPSSVEYIASDAFEDCDYLSNVTIKLSSKLAQDGISGIFPSDSRIDVSIGSNVTEIGDNAFEDMEFTDIVIPEGVETIGSYAFSGCEYLETVSLPSTIRSIESDAFEGCSSLTSVIISYDCPISKSELREILPEDCEITRR